MPGPGFVGLPQFSVESSYYTWVDQHDTLGLGANVPIATGNLFDGVHALVDGKFVTLRIPYPLGFYAKGLEGRIDDAARRMERTRPLGHERRSHAVAQGGGQGRQALGRTLPGSPLAARALRAAASGRRDDRREACGSALAAARRAAAARNTRVVVGRRPRLTRVLLDIAPNEAPHDLRGRRILGRAQLLEQLLLARIDEDRQPCGSLFRCQIELTLSDI